MPKKNRLNSAILAALGLTVVVPASADSIAMSWSGTWTFLTANGIPVINTDGSGGPWYKGRTPISGTLSYDLDTGSGSGTLVPFSFMGSGDVVASNLSLQAIGDGFGNPGTLVLGNMGFNWSGNFGIPLSIVMDAQGLFGTLTNGFTGPADVGNVSVSQTISGVGALAASEAVTFGNAMTSYTLALGPSPVVTTTWNTTNIGAVTLGTNPSGTLPLVDDGIGGSPLQQAVPFNGFNANFDLTALHIDAVITDVPVPAAVWLFGSGLMGLVGVARRRTR